jgi:hypothetical protein
MSSEVDICNLALAHLGDSATVASIDPPEGSAQAEYCARWYPIARDSLLELFDWPFAMQYGTLAAVAAPGAQWSYAYAKPSDALRIVEIMPAGSMAMGQNGIWYAPDALCWIGHNARGGSFEIGSDANGNGVIYSNTADALVRYTRAITDTSKFSPLFRDTLAVYLSSYLAGPVLKGETGISVGRARKQEAMAMLSMAKLSSAQQRSRKSDHLAPWLGAR